MTRRGFFGMLVGLVAGAKAARAETGPQIDEQVYRGGAVVAREVHNLEVVCSIHTPGIK